MLAPLASTTCSASYTVTQADLDHGSVQDSATVTGTPPGSTTPLPPSPPSTVTIPVTPAPALSIVKSASPGSVSAVGAVITYSFVVTNTGNVTLSNVGVTDTQVAPASALTSGPTCPVATLAPGASADVYGDVHGHPG